MKPWLVKQTPNGITTVRLALALAFPFLPESWHPGIIAIALASEFLDGLVARLLDVESGFGQVFDPLADKLFFFSVALTWTLMGKLTLWQWGLLALRDIGIVLIALGLAFGGRIRRVKPIKAQFLSKITTTLQYAVLLAILFHIRGPLSTLIAATAATGLLAVAQYLLLLPKSKPDEPS